MLSPELVILFSKITVQRGDLPLVTLDKTCPSGKKKINIYILLMNLNKTISRLL